MSCKKRSHINKKAFTLIELLIVIAIIGILFIVLVSKVDFATDKAKATGVQTDFRSFQLAFDTVAKENAGFNTFGYNTGDNAGAIPDGYAFESTEAENKTKGDGIRNSYDEGDKNLNGKQDVNGKDGYTGTTEVFTGRKIYTETWSEVYTLVKPGTTGLDANAVFALESAINKNLDPKLHITIASDGTIAMANQARDPWKNEYHGIYISQAERDNGADRGAIIIYSNGANGKWGSAHDITNGVVTVTVPGNNTYGKDDYSLVSCYTFVNGYGEVLNMSTGFSNNQNFMTNGSSNTPIIAPNVPVVPETPKEDEPVVVPPANIPDAGLVNSNGNVTSWNDLVSNGAINISNGVVSTNWDEDDWWNSSSNTLVGELVLPSDGSITSIEANAFRCCDGLTSIYIPYTVQTIGINAFDYCTQLSEVTMVNGLKDIGAGAFSGCENLTNVDLPSTLKSIGSNAFAYSGLTEVTLPTSIQIVGEYAFSGCDDLSRVNIVDLAKWCEIEFKDGPANPIYFGEDIYIDGAKVTNLVIPAGTTKIGAHAFPRATISSVTIPDSVTSIGEQAFYGTGISIVTISKNVSFIANDAFKYCRNLTDISVDYDNGNYKSIDGNLYTKDGQVLMQIALAKNVNTLIVPTGVEKIAGNAFYYSVGVKNVVLPSTVTSMEEYAFYSSSVESINIPGSIKLIPKYAFEYSKLKSVTIEEGVETIDSHSFRDCRSLNNVVIPASVTTIGQSAFYNDTALTSIRFVGSVGPNLNSTVFKNTNSALKIYVPSNFTTTGFYWSDYTSKLVRG